MDYIRSISLGLVIQKLARYKCLLTVSLTCKDTERPQSVTLMVSEGKHHSDLAMGLAGSKALALLVNDMAFCRHYLVPLQPFLFPWEVNTMPPRAEHSCCLNPLLTLGST